MKNDHIKKNKLMILGANPETIQIVKKANELGYYTIVVDPNQNSPAKKYAKESYELDCLKKEELLKLARREKVDGVLVGVADILVNSYQYLCENLSLPCYTSSKIQTAFKNKSAFNKICDAFEVDRIPTFSREDAIKFLSLTNKRDLNRILIKPIDNGGGVGMSVISDPNDLDEAIKTAVKHSPSKKYLIERYMDCDDMFAYYNFQDGMIHLCATADRITSKKQPGLSPVCTGAIYPSKYQDEFLERVHPKLIKMFNSLKIKNGVLNLQFFVKDKFYAYDPGFRIQGEGPHIPINDANNFNNVEMLIKFAMTSSYGVNLQTLNDLYLNKNFYATIWILLKSGKINKIDGLQEIEKKKGFVKIKQRLFVGDHITKNMVGNEKQVFARIYVKGRTRKILKKIVEEISQSVSVRSEYNENMVLDYLRSNEF